MDKQKQIEEMAKIMLNEGVGEEKIFPCSALRDSLYNMYLEDAKHLYNAGYRKIPENAVVLTDDELNEVIDTCKVSMIVTDDDGEKYISLDDHNEYTERLGKIVRQRKARIEYLEKLLDDRCDRCIERERKETAEKFAERLKASLDISVEGYSTSEVINEIEDKIDEICKEITEGKV